jgi:tetratricopeptide (TPR) repeat protein
LSASETGDNATARQYYLRSLALKEKVFGPATAVGANSLNNLCGIELAQGNLDEAERLCTRALEIRQRLLGASHPFVGSTLQELALIRMMQGRHEEAVTLARAAVANQLKAYGPTHSRVASTLADLATVLAARGDLAGARENFLKSIEAWKQSGEAEHPDAQAATVAYARFLARQKKCAEARPLLVAARDALTRSVGPTNPRLGAALAGLGRCDVDEGAAKIAVEQLERALTIYDRAGLDPVERGAVRFDLARALWATGAHPRALALAQQADNELARAADRRERERVRAWRREHN